MTADERATLATVIMGWSHPEPLRSSWITGSGDSLRYHMACRDWLPDQNLEQAMMLVDAIGKMGFDKRHSFSRALERALWDDDRKSEYLDGLDHHLYVFLFIADKLSVICQAALAVAKGMKGDEHGL